MFSNFPKSAPRDMFVLCNLISKPIKFHYFTQTQGASNIATLACSSSCRGKMWFFHLYPSCRCSLVGYRCSLPISLTTTSSFSACYLFNYNPITSRFLVAIYGLPTAIKQRRFGILVHHHHSRATQH